MNITDPDSFDWKCASSQVQVASGDFACYCMCVAISLGLGDPKTKKLVQSIKDAHQSCGALDKTLLELMNCGSALSSLVRMHLTSTDVETVDDTLVITPVSFEKFLSRFTMLIEEHQIDLASGYVYNANYTDQLLQLRTPGILSDIRPEGKIYAMGYEEFLKASSVQKLMASCFLTKESCILHLTMEFGPNSEALRKVSECHTTLLIWLGNGLCCHVDTFPACTIRVDEDETKSLKGKSRIHYHSQSTFYQWFVMTYIPARTPFVIEASRISSKTAEMSC